MMGGNGAEVFTHRQRLTRFTPTFTHQEIRIGILYVVMQVSGPLNQPLRQAASRTPAPIRNKRAPPTLPNLSCNDWTMPRTPGFFSGCSVGRESVSFPGRLSVDCAFAEGVSPCCCPANISFILAVKTSDSSGVRLDHVSRQTSAPATSSCKWAASTRAIA